MASFAHAKMTLDSHSEFIDQNLWFNWLLLYLDVDAKIIDVSSLLSSYI